MERASSAPASHAAGDVAAWALGDGASGLSAAPGLKGYLSAGFIGSGTAERGQGRPGRGGGGAEHLVPAMSHEPTHRNSLQTPHEGGRWLRSTSPPAELAHRVSALGVRPESLGPGPWSAKGGAAGRSWAAPEEGVFLGRDKHRFGPEGHTWRKYGHKTLSGTCIKRYYYACTERDSRGCPARKVVDRKASAAKGDSSGDVVNIEGTHNHGPPPSSSEDPHGRSLKHLQEAAKGAQSHSLAASGGLNPEHLQGQGSAALDGLRDNPETQKLARLWQMLLSQTSDKPSSAPLQPSTGSSSLRQSVVSWNSAFQSAGPPRSANCEGNRAPLSGVPQSPSGSPRWPDTGMARSVLSLKGQGAEQAQGMLASPLRPDLLPSAGLSQVALRQHSTPLAWAASPLASSHPPDNNPRDAKWSESLHGWGSRKRSLQGQAVLAAALLRDQSAEATWLQEELMQLPGAESTSSGSAVSLLAGDAAATDPTQRTPLHGQPGAFLAKLALHARQNSRSTSPASTNAAQDNTSLGQQGTGRWEAGKASTAANIPKSWARASGFGKHLEPSRLGQELQTQSLRVSSVRQSMAKSEWCPGEALARSLPGAEAWAGTKRQFILDGSSKASTGSPASVAMAPPSFRSEQTSVMSAMSQLADLPCHLSATHSAAPLSPACRDGAHPLGSSCFASPGELVSDRQQADPAELESSWMLPFIGNGGESQACLQFSSADSNVGMPLAEARLKRRKWIEPQVCGGTGAGAMTAGTGTKLVPELTGQEISWANVHFGDELNAAVSFVPSPATRMGEGDGPRMQQLPLPARDAEAAKSATGPGPGPAAAPVPAQVYEAGHGGRHCLAALPARVRKTEPLAVVQSSSASSAGAALKVPLQSPPPLANSGMGGYMHPSQSPSGNAKGAACAATLAIGALEGLHGLMGEAQDMIDGLCTADGNNGAISAGPACNAGSKAHSESAERQRNEESKPDDFFAGLLDFLRM